MQTSPRWLLLTLDDQLMFQSVKLQENQRGRAVRRTKSKQKQLVNEVFSSLVDWLLIIRLSSLFWLIDALVIKQALINIQQPTDENIQTNSSDPIRWSCLIIMIKCSAWIQLNDAARSLLIYIVCVSAPTWRNNQRSVTSFKIFHFLLINQPQKTPTKKSKGWTEVVIMWK